MKTQSVPVIPVTKEAMAADAISAPTRPLFSGKAFL